MLFVLIMPQINERIINLIEMKREMLSKAANPQIWRTNRIRINRALNDRELCFAFYYCVVFQALFS